VIEGEFLSADDLGPLGRLVAPGELLILEPRDAEKVREEQRWVNGRYQEADRKAEAARRRLKTAHLGGRRDVMREHFDAWTIEAAKYSLVASYLDTVARQLEAGRQQALNPKKDFKLASLPQVADVVRRVINADDSEIIGNAVFRVK
jgi:flagellar hook-associated protein FlgK